MKEIIIYRWLFTGHITFLQNKSITVFLQRKQEKNGYENKLLTTTVLDKKKSTLKVLS